MPDSALTVTANYKAVGGTPSEDTYDGYVTISFAIYWKPYRRWTERAKLGEFDCGAGSGWMVTLNNWFINQGASSFEVEDGDIIKWQYTCQYGKDIGHDWDNSSAKITGIAFKQNYGTLSPPLKMA